MLITTFLQPRGRRKKPGTVVGMLIQTGDLGAIPSIPTFAGDIVLSAFVIVGIRQTANLNYGKLMVKGKQMLT